MSGNPSWTIDDDDIGFDYIGQGNPKSCHTLLVSASLTTQFPKVGVTFCGGSRIVSSNGFRASRERKSAHANKFGRLNSMSENGGRKLFGAPVLLQDWDAMAEEGVAQYWELFLDLLLVAAASAVADQFKEERNYEEFVVFFFVMMNGWILYSHHYSTRFKDASLAHSLVLFVYVFGFGVSIVNVGFEDQTQFVVGALIQRFAIFIMLAITGHSLPRARYSCKVIGLLTIVAVTGLCVALSTNETVSRVGLWAAALAELTGEIFLVSCTDLRSFVPINIEQSKERLGALELVMLGETVLSVTLQYREGRNETTVTTSFYYWVLGLSFLLIFMVTLLYFHMQPEPGEHAFRRSRFHGTACMVVHKILALALLAVGVSIKLIAEDVLTNEPLSPQAAQLMGGGVGVFLLLLFFLRYLHYGGKPAIHFGHKVLRSGEHPDLDLVATAWWSTVGFAWVLPFLGIATGTTMKSPVAAIAWHAIYLFVLCVLESTFSHKIEDGLSHETSAGEHQHLESGSNPYQSTS